MLKVWPADRLGVHLNLMSNSYSMEDSNPKAMFSYVAQQLSERHLAYIFAREAQDFPDRPGPQVKQHFNGAWIANEGLTQQTAEALIARGDADAAAFGTLYIANPDLVERFRQNAPLNAVNNETIYSPGAAGYTDYPTLG